MMFSVSINPTFYCNLSCPFCYLSTEQLKSPQVLLLEDLRNRFKDLLASGREVSRADIYGGEVTLLHEDYVDELIKICREYGAQDVNIITNLTNAHHPVLRRKDVHVSVSYDGIAREQSERVLQNIASLGRDVEILILASPDLWNIGTDEDIVNHFRTVFTALKNATSFEIKPYSPSLHNANVNMDAAFERLVMAFLKADLNILFINELKIVESLDGKANSFSDDHIYIQPDGTFAVLDFDEQDREFFKTMSNLAEYDKWCLQEKKKVLANVYCRKCPYLSTCLSEHLREVRTLHPTCNGFRSLLDICKTSEIL